MAARQTANFDRAQGLQMAATVAQQPLEMGRLAVEKAAELAKGGMRPGRRNSSLALKLVTEAKCK